MLFVVLFISGFVAFFATVNFFINISDYYYKHCPVTPKISFKTFQNWYSLNPDRYELNYYDIRVKTDNGNEHLQFSSYFDWRRYVKLLEDIDDNDIKLQNKLQKDESLLKILNAVQDDINVARIMAENEINKVKIICSKVCSNLDN